MARSGTAHRCGGCDAQRHSQFVVSIPSQLTKGGGASERKPSDGYVAFSICICRFGLRNERRRNCSARLSPAAFLECNERTTASVPAIAKPCTIISAFPTWLKLASRGRFALHHGDGKFRGRVAATTAQQSPLCYASASFLCPASIFRCQLAWTRSVLPGRARQGSRLGSIAQRCAAVKHDVCPIGA